MRLFVRNTHGSHNPAERMEIDDFAAAASILLAFLTAEAAAG